MTRLRTADGVATASGIRAAGGVVWRPAGDAVQVCVVHRPRYDDWSLPKGKLDPGEHPMVAAVREVAEEADVRAIPQVRLPPMRYESQGRPKTVEFWSMRAVDTGGFQPGTEVDAIRWLPVDEAVRLVSYPHDVAVLRAFAALPPVTATLILVRHGHAGKRATWSGPDTARPLDGTGRVEADALAALAALSRPVRLLSAAPLRCVQTLGPLAERLDLPIEVDRYFDEPDPGQLAEERVLLAAARLVELAVAGSPVAVCSQGKVIPGALTRLTAGRADYTTPKGGGWLLAFSADRLVAADRL